MRALERRLLAAWPARLTAVRIAPAGTIPRTALPPTRSPRPGRTGFGPCRAVRGGSVKVVIGLGNPGRSTPGRATTSAGWSSTGSPSGPAGPAGPPARRLERRRGTLPRPRPHARQAADLHERLGPRRPQGPGPRARAARATCSSSPTTSRCRSASCASARAAAPAATTACARSSTSSGTRSSAGCGSASATRSATAATTSCRSSRPTSSSGSTSCSTRRPTAVEAWARDGHQQGRQPLQHVPAAAGRRRPARARPARSTARPARTASGARRPAGGGSCREGRRADA